MTYHLFWKLVSEWTAIMHLINFAIKEKLYELYYTSTRRPSLMAIMLKTT